MTQDGSPTVQLFEELVGTEHASPGCSQLDCQRETIEPAAHLCYGGELFSVRKLAPGIASLAKELDSRGFCDAICRGIRQGSFQWLDRNDVLPGQA
jgi:hypothetical protein